MHAKMDNEYYYQMIYIYRKTIPSNPLFYYILFGLKFVGIYLLTHDINLLESKVYTLEMILQNLAFLSNNLNIFIGIYEWISIFILCFLILIIAVFITLIIRFRIFSTNVLQIIEYRNITPFGGSPHDYTTLRILTVVYLIIVFLSQHIVEFLIFSILPLIHSYKSQHPNDSRHQTLQSFITKLYLNHYLLLGINSISIVIIIGFIYLFLYLSASMTLVNKCGFNLNIDHLDIIIWVIIFQAQGCYSVTNYIFTASNNIKFIFCLIYFGILLISFISNLRQYNHSRNTLCFYINFLINSCLISAIVELIMFKIVKNDLSQVDSTMKFLLLVINTFSITALITFIKKRINSKIFLKNLFSENYNQTYQSLVEFSNTIANYIHNRDDILYTFQFLETHRINCKYEECQCHKEYKQFKNETKEKQQEKIIKIFIMIAEQEIVSLINKHKEKEIKIDKIKKLYFLHVDFTLTIKKNYFLASYLAIWYQYSKRHYLDFFTKYMFYEIQEEIITKSIEKKGIFSGKINRLSYDCNKESGYSKNSKQLKLLHIQLFNDNLLQSIYKCLKELERFSYYRNIVRMGIKILFTCEDFLKTIISYLEQYDMMIRILDNFLLENNEIPSSLIELSYILQYYFILFKGKISQRYKGKITVFPKYVDYLDNNISDEKYIILYLSNDEKTIIDYISIRLVDELNYTKEELKGSDMNEKLVPGYISSHHYIYLKGFIIQGIQQSKKNCYILNKKRNIAPYEISSRPLPSYSKKLCLISKINQNLHLEKNQNNTKGQTYYICTDCSFNILSISSNFSKSFVFSIPMFNTLKINLCSFFGIKEEEIKNYFKSKKKKNTSIKGKELRRSILATIPKENEKAYNDVFSYLIFDEEPVERTIYINKKKLISSIKKLDKTVDELGLDQNWKVNIDELISRFGENNNPNDNINNISHNIYLQNASRSIVDYFSFLFKSKHIGNLYYYIVVLRDNSPNSTPIKEQEEIYDDDDKSIVLNTPISNLSPKITSDDHKNNFLYALSKEQSITDLNSRKDLNQSSNNSKNYMLHNMNGTSSIYNQFDFILNDSNDKDYKVIQQNINNSNKQLKLLKILQLVIFAICITINIINFTVNSEFVKVSSNLFNINTYSFLLSSDIFFSSLGCIRACFVKEGIQTGDINFFQTKIHYHSSKMLEHFQHLQKFVQNMTDSQRLDKIFQILLEEADYYIMLPNWEILIKRSSLMEEIYYLHYYLTNFDLTTDKSCKLDLYYNGMETQTKEEDPTDQERIVYYIVSNIISKISISLYKLTQTTDEQLGDYSIQANVNLTLFNSLILFVTLVLYILQIIYICKLKNVFEKIMIRFFYKEEGEDEFNSDVEKLKNLLMHFSKSECLKFEGKTNIHHHVLFNSTILETSIKNCHMIQQNSTFVSFQQPQQIEYAKSTRKNKSRAKSPKLATPAQRQQAQKKQTNELNMNDFKIKAIQKLTRVKLMSVIIFIICFLFASFSSIQLSNIFISNQSSNNIKLQNIFTSYYLLRLPKFAELAFYSEITVITKNLNLIDSSEIDLKLENIYNIQINKDNNSLLNSLKNKYYIKLYNQLFIIRNTLGKLFNDQSKSNMFPIVQEIDRNLQGNMFCLSIGKEYMLTVLDGKIDNWTFFFAEASKESKQCRLLGNGINESGLKIVFDFLVQNLNVLYVEFENKILTPVDAQKDFITNKYIELIFDELQTTFSTVHIILAYNIIKDMVRSLSSKYNVEIIFSSLSILFSCVFFVLLTMIIINTFEKYNKVASEFWIRLEKALKLRQKAG